MELLVRYAGTFPGVLVGGVCLTLSCLISTVAMTGALAWQVKQILNKKLF